MSKKKPPTRGKYLGRKLKFKLCPQKKIAAFYAEATEIAEGLGVFEPLMTDQSVVGDFAATSRKLASLSKRLGIRLESGTRMWEAAKALSDKRMKI